MLQNVCCNFIRHMTETGFICPMTFCFNPSFVIGFSQAAAQTSEGCGVYGHGQEQCRSRCAWPSFCHIFNFPSFPDGGVFTCLLSDCYVADELVVSRAGRRVRVGNTDAEGRMAMVDLLCEMKEKVLLYSQSFDTSFIPWSPNFSSLTVIFSSLCAGSKCDCAWTVYHCYSDWSCYQSNGSQLLCEYHRNATLLWFSL